MYRKLAWLGIPHPRQASDEVLQWLLQYETYEEMALAITSCCPWDYGNDMDDFFWIRSLDMGFDAAVGFDRQSVCYDTTEREQSSTRSWRQIRRSYIRSI